jgi:predicted metalloendopeptidase
MRTKKNKSFYTDIRKKSKDIDILDFVKVPSFSKSQKNDILKLKGKTIDDELVDLLKKRSTGLKHTPQDDYYNFINQEWLENVKKNADKHKTFYVKQDDIRIIQENTAHNLLKILKMNDKQKKVFNSFKEINRSNMIRHIKELDISLQTIFKKNNFYELMAFMHRNPLFASSFPIYWNMGTNLKNSKYYCNNIYPASLTIFDNTLYFPVSPSDKKRQDYQKKLYASYSSYVKDIFDNQLKDQIDFMKIFRINRINVHTYNYTKDTFK